MAFCLPTGLLTAEKHAPGGPYLQCTTMGPASGGLQVLTLRRKARKGVGCSGTPWSGQAVNWNCLTSLFSLDPFCGAGTLAETPFARPQVARRNNAMREVTRQCAISTPPPPATLWGDTLSGDTNPKLLVNDRYLLKGMEPLGEQQCVFQLLLSGALLLYFMGKSGSSSAGLHLPKPSSRARGPYLPLNRRREKRLRVMEELSHLHRRPRSQEINTASRYLISQKLLSSVTERGERRQKHDKQTL